MTRDADLLDLHRIDGPVTTSAFGRRRTIWYTLPPQRWSFRTTTDRLALLHSIATGHAGLVGHRFHLLPTTIPYPVHVWARNVTAAFPHALPGWSDHILAKQQDLLHLTLADKLTCFGVQLNTPSYRSDADERARIHAALTRPGLDGRPVTPEELELLLHRSVALGAPALLTRPSAGPVWEPTDLATFTDRVWWDVAPYGRTVRVTADYPGNERRTRHVAALTLGRMKDLPVLEGMGPWMTRGDALGIPIEWSVIGEVLPADVMRSRIAHTLDRIKAQIDHYANDHDMRVPTELEEQEARAVRIQTDVANTDPLHTRVECWVRAFVSGETEREALDHAEAVIEHYMPHMPFHRGKDQYRTAREAIPGNALSTRAHRRQMPVTTFAAALPNATPVIGDRVGFHMGHTVGVSPRAYLWHPWHAMEVRERPGLTIVAAIPGGGKSTVAGELAYQSALAGIRTVILDPSGPLAGLASVPELAGHASAVDLMNAQPGALNPYYLVPDPRPEHFEVERADAMGDDAYDEARRDAKIDYERARRGAVATRRNLVIDTLMSLLPEPTRAHDRTQRVITEAFRTVPNTRHSNPWPLLDAMTATGDAHARYVADEIRDLAELPQVRLIFPEDDTPLNILDDELVLQILTMRGNVLPPDGKPREKWSIAEIVGVPLMSLAAYLASLHVYGRDRHERKLLILDEVQALFSVAPGKALAHGITRDSRKHDTRVCLLGQNVTDSLAADVDNLVDTVLIGRTEGEEQQAAGLKALRVPRGQGFEAVLGGLSENIRQATERSGFREFVINDGDGGIEIVRIDRSAAVARVLDTTADPTRVRPRLSVIKTHQEATA